MLELNKIVVGYDRPVAGPLDLYLPDGHCMMLCGPNGSGKSTLMKTVAGIIRPVSGSFAASGEVVMVPTRIPKVKGFTVRDFVRTGMFSRSSLWNKVDDETADSVESALQTLGLAGLASKDLSVVSDGEFQKACIATALVRKSSVMLLDEPTAFLDVDNRVMVLRTLHEIAASTGITVIFSTHDIHDGKLNSDSVLDLGLSQSR